MVHELNPGYDLPSAAAIGNTPSWYSVAKQDLILELKQTTSCAATSDGWTSIAQDHYLTITVHFIIGWKLHSKVLETKVSYDSQTGEVICENIKNCLVEYDILDKVCIFTVDNAANIGLAIEMLEKSKIGCFGHSLNISAQKVMKSGMVARWLGKIRAIVIWFRRPKAKPVLKEKQELLSLPVKQLILDVKTSWYTTYLMITTFNEAFPAIQAAGMDPRLKKSIEKER